MLKISHLRQKYKPAAATGPVDNDFEYPSNWNAISKSQNCHGPPND